MGKKDNNEALIDSSIKRRFWHNYGTKCGKPKSDQTQNLYDQNKLDRTWSPQIIMESDSSSHPQRFRASLGSGLWAKYLTLRIKKNSPTPMWRGKKLVSHWLIFETDPDRLNGAHIPLLFIAILEIFGLCYFVIILCYSRDSSF